MLTERIDSEFKQAMKDKAALKVSTLSFLRSQLKYLMIEKKAEALADADVVLVIKKQIKQRQESIDQYQKGGRADLADKEKAEMDILKAYLPEEMSAGELKAIVDLAVKESGASGMKDMGNVMKLVLPKVAGRADNKAVSELIKATLTGM